MVTQTRHSSQQRVDSDFSPHFLLRIGGLPINVVDDLRFSKTLAWAETLFALEEQLETQKEGLVQVLHDAVHTHKEDLVLRRNLLALKRNVFNMRRPANLATSRALIPQLTSETARQHLTRWISTWEAYELHQSEGDNLFTQELSEKRQLLKTCVQNADFRKGILLSSPQLDQSIAGYLAADNQHLNREARTVERSLMEYLLRTACKTSPFSTFTPVSPGTITDEATDSTQDIELQITEVKQRAYTRLNMAILARISHAIMLNDELRETLPMQVVSGWQKDGDRIRYVRSKSHFDAIDEEAPTIVDRHTESVIFLPHGQLLARLLQLLEHGDTLTLGEIIVQLSQDEENATTQGEVRAYLQHLLRLGLLIVPLLQPDMHSPQPVHDYYQGLRSLNQPQTNEIARLLELADQHVQSYAQGTLEERRELSKAIKTLITECFSVLGTSGAQVPRTILYEDTTLAPQQLAINARQWEDVRESMAQFQQLLPAFDMNLSRRLATKGYFRVRYGQGGHCDDFVSFAQEFHRDFFEYFSRHGGMLGQFEREKGFVAGENYFKLPEVTMLDEAHQAMANYISQAYADLPAESKELILDEDFLQTILPFIPSSTDLQSHTLFSQFAREGETPLLILNRVYTGLTLMFTRFAHCFSEEEQHWLVPSLRATLRRMQPDNAVFAELKGGYTSTNLNLHPQLTEYELVCSGDISSRPVEEQIALDDLYVQDDTETNTLRLYSRRLEKEVIPIYLGFLFPLALPEIQQVLLNFSYATMCPVYMWQGTRTPSAGNTIANYPRIRYKNVVLHRALWKMHPDYMPKRASGQSDLDFFLDYLRWHRRHKIPNRVFVTPDMLNARPSAEDDEMGQRSQSYKPLYVDFENLFSVMLLESTVRGSSQRLVMTEMLPHRDQLWFKQDEQAYVTEFVLEINSQHRSAHHG